MSKRPTPPALNTDYATARPVLLTGGSGLHLVLVGCGGTGSWLAPTLARLAAVLNGAGRPTHLTFIDPDHVEAGNVPRQNFCAAEIGAAKAGALALRYMRAWGVDITVIQAPLDQAQLTAYYGKELLILCGAVDNATARRSLTEELQTRTRYASYQSADPPHTWWLDCVRFVPSKRKA